MGLLANNTKTQTDERVLVLPKPHSAAQAQLIYAWKLRYDPLRPELGEFFNPYDPEWDYLPLAFPGLRFTAGACGTKFGKTYGCGIWLAERAWEKIDPRTGLELPGPGKYWWVAPTFDQAENAFDAIQTLFPEGTFEANFTKGKQKIFLKNPDGSLRSLIEFKSGADPATLRGFGVHAFVMDEVAQGMPLASYTSVMTTTTMTRGCGIIISTPNGRGWFYDKYQRGVKRYANGTPKFGPDHPDPFPHWYSIRMPTHANPYVDIEEIETKRKELSHADFEQEYLAVFRSDGQGVFSNIKECTKGVLQEPIDTHYYAVGVDLGDKKDYTVVTVMDRITKHVVYWERFNNKGWAWQKQRIIEVGRKYNNAVLVVDTTGIGDPIVEELSLAGLPIIPYKISNSAAKENLIDRLVVAMEQLRISFPHLPILIDELNDYELKTSAMGARKFSAPSGKNDDAVISLALCVQVADQPIPKYRYQQIRGV